MSDSNVYDFETRRPRSREEPAKTFGAISETPSSASERISWRKAASRKIQKQIELDPKKKLSPGDQEKLLGKMAAILDEAKHRGVNMGDVCARSGFKTRDGFPDRDPKRLQPYRRNFKDAEKRKDEPRKIKQAAKYISVLRALAQCDKSESFDALVVRAFANTDFLPSDLTESDPASHVLEIVEEAVDSITHETRLTEAFKLATGKFDLLTSQKANREKDRFAAQSDAHYIWEDDPLGTPSVPLYSGVYSLDAIFSSSPQLRNKGWACSLSDGRAASIKLWSRVLLALLPGADLSIKAYLVSETSPLAVAQGDIADVVDVNLHSKGIVLRLKDGETATLKYRGYQQELDRLSDLGLSRRPYKKEGKSNQPWFLVQHQLRQHLLNLDSSSPIFSAVDMIGLRYCWKTLSHSALERLNSKYTPGLPDVAPDFFEAGVPASSWSDTTENFGAAPLSRILNGFAKDKIAVISDAEVLKALDVTLPTGRAPDAGWYVIDPKTGRRSLPDLLWQLADHFAEAQIETVREWEAESREKQENELREWEKVRRRLQRAHQGK